MGTIVHFGIDEQAALPVLTQAGYKILTCGTSIALLSHALDQNDPDAVAISEATHSPNESLWNCIRSRTKAPVVIFAGVTSHCNLPEVDLVIAPLTPTREWLTAIAALVEDCRARRKEVQQTRESASHLRREAEGLREKAAETRRVSEDTVADVAKWKRRKPHD